MDNLTYVNTDVYGDFALAGSIFLDSRCDRTFHEKYALLYGHHMDNSKMFGDLDLYEDQAFFEENISGMLILPDRAYELETFAFLKVPASEDAIFSPQQWQTDTDGLLEFVQKEAVYIREDVMGRIGTTEDLSQILAMSTCSSEYTDARTILLAVMKPYAPQEESGE